MAENLVSKKLGTLVVFGVPVIVGGGITYALFHNYHAVAVFEIILILFAGGLVAKQ